jgi:hypothetical protein
LALKGNDKGEGVVQVKPGFHLHSAFSFFNTMTEKAPVGNHGRLNAA